ncbi:MAG: alkaline phosphatase D family protein, partial [Ilumatobacter sp.]
MREVGHGRRPATCRGRSHWSGILLAHRHLTTSHLHLPVGRRQRRRDRLVGGDLDTDRWPGRPGPVGRLGRPDQRRPPGRSKRHGDRYRRSRSHCRNRCRRPGTGHRLHLLLHGRRGDRLGRTRTLPRRADQLRFVVACCSRRGWPGFDRYSDIADERPDFVLHLGDSIYEIGEVPPSGEPTDPPWACHSLDDYRRRHRQHRSHPALQRLLASVPLIAIWDDHEVVDNAPDRATADRRRAGQQAWREFMPMRR